MEKLDRLVDINISVEVLVTQGYVFILSQNGNGWSRYAVWEQDHEVCPNWRTIENTVDVKDYGSHCVTIFQKSSIYSDPGNYLLPGDGDVNEMRM